MKTYNNEYNCSRIMNTMQANLKWLALKLLPFPRSNVSPLYKDVVTYVKKTFHVSITLAKTYRALVKAKSLMMGSAKD